jgi:hypothetical protein
MAQVVAHATYSTAYAGFGYEISSIGL